MFCFGIHQTKIQLLWSSAVEQKRKMDKILLKKLGLFSFWLRVSQGGESNKGKKKRKPKNTPPFPSSWRGLQLNCGAPPRPPGPRPTDGPAAPSPGPPGPAAATPAAQRQCSAGCRHCWLWGNQVTAQCATEWVFQQATSGQQLNFVKMKHF